MPGHVLLIPFLKDIADSVYSVHIAFEGVIHDRYAAKAIILAYNADSLRHHYVIYVIAHWPTLALGIVLY